MLKSEHSALIAIEKDWRDFANWFILVCSSYVDVRCLLDLIILQSGIEHQSSQFFVIFQEQQSN